MVENVCPFPGARQNCLFPLHTPLPHIVAKALPVVRLENKRLILSIDVVVGLALLATTLADKHIGTLLPTYVLLRRSQRLESLVTYITGVNPLSLVSFVPTH